MSDKNNKNNRPSFRKPKWTEQQRWQPMERKYYDNADMMQLFNVSSRTLQRWRKEGELPFKKIGGKIYYVAEEVDRMMREGRD